MTILNESGLKKHWQSIPKTRKKMLLKLAEAYIKAKRQWGKGKRKRHK